MIVLQPESNKNQNSGKEKSMKKEKIKTVDGQTLLLLLSAGSAGQAVLEFTNRKRYSAVTVFGGQPQPYPAAADGSD